MIKGREFSLLWNSYTTYCSSSVESLYSNYVNPFIFWYSNFGLEFKERKGLTLLQMKGPILGSIIVHLRPLLNTKDIPKNEIKPNFSINFSFFPFYCLLLIRLKTGSIYLYIYLIYLFISNYLSIHP